MNNPIRFAFLCGLTILLIGCTASPTPQGAVLPQLTFEHLRPIPVNVRSIDLKADAQRGAKPWAADISNDLPTPPNLAVKRYLEHRYQAAGSDGVLEIDLLKADMIHRSVPNPNVFLSHVSFVNNDEYSLEILVNLAGRYLSGKAERETHLRFVRKITIAPHVTPAYREQKLQRFVEEVVRDLDEAMIASLADDYQMVATKDIPVNVIDIKTEEPVVDTVIIKQKSLNQ